MKTLLFRKIQRLSCSPSHLLIPSLNIKVRWIDYSLPVGSNNLGCDTSLGPFCGSTFTFFKIFIICGDPIQKWKPLDSVQVGIFVGLSIGVEGTVVLLNVFIPCLEWRAWGVVHWWLVDVEVSLSDYISKI